MTKQVQRRRGTSTQHTSFTGAEGEISVNTTNKSIHVHDGATAGGVEAARADLGNVSDADLNSALSGNTLSSLTVTSADINGGNIDGTVIGATTPAAITGTTGTFSGDFAVDTNTLFVDVSTNSVGIGTNSPSAFGGTLSVLGAALGGETTIVLSNNNSSQFVRLGINSNEAQIVYDNADELVFGQALSSNDAGIATEHMRIDSAGRVLQGTESSITGAGGVKGLDQVASTSSSGRSGFTYSASNTAASVYEMCKSANATVGSHTLVANNESLGTIRFSGSDGTNFIRAAEIGGLVDGAPGTSDMPGALTFSTTADGGTSPAERMRIKSSGRVGIGETNPQTSLHISSTVPQITLTDTSTGVDHLLSGNSGVGNLTLHVDQNNEGSAPKFLLSVGSASSALVVKESGNVDISGALSKGSGSFKIDHPLKPDTHHLVHSFLEGPQADNLYRGKVTLVDGRATVNLDDAGRMSEGTFVALNGNVQCFTTNENGWTQVRGSVDGNTLTIEAQDDTCTDEVSWLVIGERHDPHMLDTGWTDENGRVITEPEKEDNIQ